jgi:hypothetical protein
MLAAQGSPHHVVDVGGDLPGRVHHRDKACEVVVTVLNRLVLSVQQRTKHNGEDREIAA